MQPLPWRPWSAIAVLALAGCAPADAPPAAAPAPVAARAAVPADDDPSSIVPDLMALLVDPAAGVLLAAAEAAGSEHAPASPEAWQAVGDAAAQLEEGGAFIARPALAASRGDWIQLTAAMRSGAAAVASAARQRDAAALAEAGARVRASCQGCHALYAQAPPGTGRPAWR